MGNEPQEIITDPQAFLRLTTEEQIRNFLLLTGRTAEQVEVMMSRHAPIGVLAHNVTICKASIGQICECMPAKVEQELATYPPPGLRRWTFLEECKLVIALARDPIAVPAMLMDAFDSINTRRDPASEPASEPA